MIRRHSLFLLIAFFLTFVSVAYAQQGAKPDGETGLTIFAERCVNCHGPLGLGDGQMTAQLAAPPPAFSDPTYLRQAVPSQMLDTIANGDVTRGMPPFGSGNSNPISDEDQWNLVAAVFSLGTPAGAIEQGQATYQTNCQTCHGETGVSATLDLSGRDYWLNQSNQALFDILKGDTIAEHQYTLSEDDLWFVVDYIRSLSYRYRDPLLAFAPLETATISGSLINGTTQTPLPDGTSLTLTAFDDTFQPTLTLTTTVDASGNYQFGLTNVLPAWSYLVTVNYQGINFGSESGKLSHDSPTLDLPVSVYEPSTDASHVTIDQLHVILDFSNGLVQVNELYQFSQNDLTVFVGENGDVTQGTVEISVPAGASPPAFSRSFGSLDSFFPATDMIQTANGWADVVPLRPGSSSLSLLVRYTLPYNDNLDLSHTILYNLGGVNLVIPDVGVTLSNANQWVAQGAQVIAEGSFLSFTHELIPAGDKLIISLSGQPSTVTTSNSGTVLARNQTNELLVGGTALAFTLGVAIYFIQQWQQQDKPENDPGRDELLQTMAELDDNFAAGRLTEEEYGRQRQALKEQVAAIWERES